MILRGQCNGAKHTAEAADANIPTGMDGVVAERRSCTEAAAEAVVERGRVRM